MSDSVRRRLFLAGVLAVSTGVVVTSFNPAPHSGGDNAGYLSLAHGLLVDGAYTDAFDPEGLPHTKYPPVFPALLAILMSLGARSWVAFKATAAVSTVAAVGLTYLWAERRLGDVSAFAVGILLALSTAVVYYSHWILSDPVFLALTLASLAALERASDEEAHVGWLAVGVAAAGLAFFTRQAGLPLVVAIVAWLSMGRRWRSLAATAVAIGVPALAWWWRARGVAVASYGDEFWMVNPYDPSLGTVGVIGLVPRALANLGSYVLTHGPGGIVGQSPPVVGLLGVGITTLAIGGWVLSVRVRVGPAELFFPLYAGLILLWPEVWAGDRFALPLYPLVFVYGAVALRELGTRLPTVASTLLTAAALLSLLLPAGRSWLDATREASACADVVLAGGAFGCYGPRIGAFVGAAEWMGGALPEGSVVMSRKPRHFYLLSGLPSRTFPFDEDPAAHLRVADAIGARYVLLDQWDGLASRYVGAAIGGNPGAYCYLGDLGHDTGASAQLFGIRTPDDRPTVVGAPEAELQIGPCPADYLRETDRSYSPPSSGSPRVPLLDGLGS